MAVIRTVFVPLSREPEIVFGLKLSDIVWPAASAVVGLAIWHGWKVAPSVRLSVILPALAGGLGLAIVRIEETSLPQWMVRLMLFWIKDRLFLP